MQILKTDDGALPWLGRRDEPARYGRRMTVLKVTWEDSPSKAPYVMLCETSYSEDDLRNAYCVAAIEKVVKEVWAVMS